MGGGGVCVGIREVEEGDRRNVVVWRRNVDARTDGCGGKMSRGRDRVGK